MDNRKKQHNDKELLEIDKKKKIKIAKQLGYTRLFPEIKKEIKSASSLDEISKIMCTYRNYSIKQELKEKENQKERNKEKWIII